MNCFNPKERSFYSDAPHENPGLNFKIYASKLAETATRPLMDNLSGAKSEESGGAFTVGIFGHWGSGKTTLMREIERQIIAREEEQNRETTEKRYKYKTVWFNPWKYDRTEDIQNALIQSILRSIISDQEIQSNPVAKRNLIQMARNFGKVTTGISVRVASAAIQQAINIDTKSIADGIDKEIKEHSQEVGNPDGAYPEQGYFILNSRLSVLRLKLASRWA
jgi:energy-coupling factor transporter ATP-binding protein EcfA2